MTVSAHGATRVYSGGTRHGGIIDYAPNHSTTFFNELNPHLKNVRATTQTRVQLIHAYLLRRPGRTVTQIVAKLEHCTRREVERLLTGNPTLFRRTGRTWDAIEQAAPVAHPRVLFSGELAAAIDDYLRQYGPSTVREITDGIGHHDIRYVSATIAKPPCKAVRLGYRRKGSQVWGINDGA